MAGNSKCNLLASEIVGKAMPQTLRLGIVIIDLVHNADRRIRSKLRSKTATSKLRFHRFKHELILKARITSDPRHLEQLNGFEGFRKLFTLTESLESLRAAIANAFQRGCNAWEVGDVIDGVFWIHLWHDKSHRLIPADEGILG